MNETENLALAFRVTTATRKALERAVAVERTSSLVGYVETLLARALADGGHIERQHPIEARR